MLVALGWMLLAGSPLPSPAPVHIAVASETRSTAPAARRVTVWTDRQDPYRRGEGARVYLNAHQSSYVTVFRVDTDGRLRVLFPREPWGQTYVRDGRDFEISGARGGRSFIVDDDPGVGFLFAIASSSPFDYAAITRGDHWDYRLIDGGRLEGDPYVLLTDLAGRIAGGAEYDYDIVPYHVDGRYAYPRFICYDCHAYASYDEWDPYERACSRFRVVIYDDPRYYPYRYNQGRNVVAERPRRLEPRYVFRDIDPRSEYVTRLQHRRGEEQARTSDDVGGQGTVPTPGLQAPGGRSPGAPGPGATAARQRAEERRRDQERPRREAEEDDGQVPEGLRPANEERRLAPQDRPSRPPRSTGEPELRRRRP